LKPLIRQQRGGAAATTDFNDPLKQNLELIGADPSITLHCFRSFRMAEAGERGEDRGNIAAGSGHSLGSHTDSYRAISGGWVLGGAGYQKTQGGAPEIQAAHVRALYEALQTGTAERLLEILFVRWRPAFLALEDAAPTGGPAAHWCALVRHCITAWVVSCAARPRDPNCRVNEESPVKRHLIHPKLLAHMDVLFKTRGTVKQLL